MVFDRRVGGRSAATRVLGVGSKVVNAALHQARAYPVSATTLPAPELPQPLLVFRIYDRITGAKFVNSVIAGVALDLADPDASSILPDWQLLVLLNKLLESRWGRSTEAVPNMVDPKLIDRSITIAQAMLTEQLIRFGLPFTRPEIELLTLFWPQI